jgi:uncharacterized cupredoxin-like copper-binding protein
MAMGSSFHAVNPQAAVFWNPANSASGTFTLKGTFTLLKPSGHTNYFGLIFGGADLEGPKQNYLYFLVAQDGKWLIKHRADDATTHTVVDKTANAAVKVPDASGKSVNALEVRAGADKVEFVVNGTVVHSAPRAGFAADGLTGIRINHQLEVQIDGFAVVKK